MKGRIHGVYGVNGPKLRLYGTADLIAVIINGTPGLLGDADMSMSLNQSGQNPGIPRFNHLLSCFRLRSLLYRSYILYFFIFTLNIPIIVCRALHGTYLTAKDQHKKPPFETPVYRLA